VPGGHQKYFGKTQQSKLVKTRRDSAEVHAECRVCMFVIDGKDHDQQRRDNGMAMESSTSDHWIPFRSVNSRSQGSDVGRFTVGRQQWKTGRQGRSTTMMAWKDQKRKLHFRVSDTGSWRSQELRLFITGVPKLRNAKRRNPETGTSTKTPFQSFADRKSKVSDTGSWRSQESRLFITGVPKLRNEKRRNPETGTSTKTPFSEFCRPGNQRFQILGVGGVKSRDSSSQESRSCEMRNAEIPKKVLTTKLHFIDRTWRVKMPLITYEIAKCEKHLLV
jgi:hypothetical protein